MYPRFHKAPRFYSVHQIRYLWGKYGYPTIRQYAPFGRKKAIAMIKQRARYLHLARKYGYRWFLKLKKFRGQF